MTADKPTIEEIKARIRVVCICKGIKMAKVCDAIKKGAATVEAVNKATGSGNGGCGATRCRPVIEALIKTGGTPVSADEMEKLRTGTDGAGDAGQDAVDDDWFLK